MEITEQELRSMVRDAIARQRGGVAAAPLEPEVRVALQVSGHASHGLLPLVPSGGDECIIEPSVRCDHCGYCKSLGH